MKVFRLTLCIFISITIGVCIVTSTVFILFPPPRNLTDLAAVKFYFVMLIILFIESWIISFQHVKGL